MNDVWHVRAPLRLVSALARLTLCVPLHACMYDWDLREARDGALRADGDAERDPNAAEDETDTDATLPMQPSEDVDAGWPDAATSGNPATNDGAPGSLPDLDAMVLIAIPDALLPDSATASGDAQPPTGVDAATAFVCDDLDAAFCSDFDQSTLEIFSWQEVTAGTRASVSLVDGGAAPAGLALRSALGGSADESARAVVGLLHGAPSWFRGSFDYYPSLDVPAEGDEPIFWFRLTEQSGDAYRGVFLGTWRNGTQLVVQNFDGVNETWDSYPTAPLPAGWVRVELELHLGRQGSATVRFNGAVALEHLGPIYVTNVEQSFVQLGLYSEPATLSWALYDNVVLEYAP